MCTQVCNRNVASTANYFIYNIYIYLLLNDLNNALNSKTEANECILTYFLHFFSIIINQLSNEFLQKQTWRTFIFLVCSVQCDHQLCRTFSRNFLNYIINFCHSFLCNILHKIYVKGGR